MKATPFDYDTFKATLFAWGDKYKITPPELPKGVTPDQFLHAMFNMADANHDHKISKAELEKALEEDEDE